MPYEYRGDIAHADIAFNAWAPSLNELYAEAARATMQVMVEELASIRPLESREATLSQSDPEMLLFDFLNELIFYKDAERLLLLPEQIAISGSGQEGGYSLKATLQGEQIEPGRHRLDTDVKAVTMLRFSVAQVAEGWRCTVVLDV